MIDVCRLICLANLISAWIVIRPKFENRKIWHDVELPSPVPRLFEKTYKKNRVKSYLTLKRLLLSRKRARCVHIDDPERRARAREMSRQIRQTCSEMLADAINATETFVELNQHLFLHQPERYYGPGFDAFCKLLHPLDTY